MNLFFWLAIAGVVSVLATALAFIDALNMEDNDDQ